MMQIEESITIAAPPQRIFALYADVARWNTWDPDTREASIDGPFRTGARGRLVPTKGRAVPMELTSVVEDRSFTAQARIPLFTMDFDHELLAQGATTRVVHRVRFSGALAFVLGRLVGAQVRKGLPVTLASLKRHAEQPSGA